MKYSWIVIWTRIRNGIRCLQSSNWFLINSTRSLGKIGHAKTTKLITIQWSDELWCSSDLMIQLDLYKKEIDTYLNKNKQIFCWEIRLPQETERNRNKSRIILNDVDRIKVTESLLSKQTVSQGLFHLIFALKRNVKIQ